MKTCSTCKRQLPLGAFYRHATAPPGVQSDCKECQRTRNARPHFKRWRNIKDRLFKEGHKEFANYGGRGITMWAAWRHSYEAFRHSSVSVGTSRCSVRSFARWNLVGSSPSV
jgi:hypothetical protein